MEKPIVPGGDAESPAAEKKFWEGPYPEKQAPLMRKPNLAVIKSRDNEMIQQEIDQHNESVEQIEKMTQRLKEEGHEFELTDDDSEYILRAKGFEGVTHITKVNDPRHVDIKGIIFARITQPERE
jgi:N-dimethylarginine dimethylaminohydrolase